MSHLLLARESSSRAKIDRIVEALKRRRDNGDEAYSDFGDEVPTFGQSAARRRREAAEGMYGE